MKAGLILSSFALMEAFFSNPGVCVFQARSLRGGESSWCVPVHSMAGTGHPWRVPSSSLLFYSLSVAYQCWRRIPPSDMEGKGPSVNYDIFPPKQTRFISWLSSSPIPRTNAIMHRDTKSKFSLWLLAQASIIFLCTWNEHKSDPFPIANSVFWKNRNLWRTPKCAQAILVPVQTPFYPKSYFKYVAWKVSQSKSMVHDPLYLETAFPCRSRISKQYPNDSH